MSAAPGTAHGRRNPAETALPLPHTLPQANAPARRAFHRHPPDEDTFFLSPPVPQAARPRAPAPILREKAGNPQRESRTGPHMPAPDREGRCGGVFRKSGNSNPRTHPFWRIPSPRNFCETIPPALRRGHNGRGTARQIPPPPQKSPAGPHFRQIPRWSLRPEETHDLHTGSRKKVRVPPPTLRGPYFPPAP